jgi:hypothetical protein
MNPPLTATPTQLPRVRLFCPNCGERASIRAAMPTMFAPEVEEITYACGSCRTETKVQVYGKI